MNSEVGVCRIDHWAYDSRKETCFVCTRNQVGNGYMDSLIQTLYHTPCFGNVPLGLQNLFFKFQYSDSSVATEELTKSFGRDTHHSFVQHDVQRFTRVTCKKLEDKAKVGQRWEEVSNKSHNAVLKLFPEIENGLDLWSLPTEKSKEDYLVFFELYDPQEEELCFVVGLFMKASREPSEILAKLNEMAGFRPHERTEVHVARGKFMFAAISYKYSHEANLGVFHPSLQLCKYSCRSCSSSKNLCFAPMDACSISWIMVLQRLAIHLRSMCFFRDDEHGLPPLEIVAGGFAELPQEILMDIFALLDVPDLVRVGSVCTSWNSAYTSICSFGQYKWPQTPCLIYTSESAGENVAFLYSLAEKRAYKLTLPEPPIHSRYLIGSSHGWLVTADERSEMHLVNPITREQISLPSVITIEQVTPIFDEGVICKYRYSRHTAESVIGPPSTHSLNTLRDHLFHKALLFYDTSAGSYFVVLIHNPFGQLSFARLGDEKWTWLPPHTHFEDCIYKDGLLYAVTLLGTIIAFDLSGTVVTTKIIMDRKDFYGNERVYIVQAPWGDLLQVRRPEVWINEVPDVAMHDACAGRATFENTTWRIEIYKVCIASRKLVQINSLDDHVLFLGHNQSLCSRAEEYPHVKPNHVYFTDDCKSVSLKCRLHCRLVIGILNLETKSMDEIVSPRPWSNCMAPLLIIPNPRKMGVGSSPLDIPSHK